MMKKTLAVFLVLGILLILTGSILSGFAPKANAGGPGTRGSSGSSLGPAQQPLGDFLPEALLHPWGDTLHEEPNQRIPPRHRDACILSECRKHPTKPSVLTGLFLRLYLRYVVKQEMSGGNPTKCLGK